MCYAIKEMCSILVEQELSTNPSDGGKLLRDRQKEQELLLISHHSTGFPGLFRDHWASNHGGRVEDEEEHVMRCVRCHWEIEGEDLECTHCGYIFSDNGDVAPMANIVLTSDGSTIDTDTEENTNEVENEVRFASNIMEV